MKSKFQAAALAGTAILAASFGTTGANAAVREATAKAKIVSAVTVAKVTDLNFGTIVPFTAARDVTVAANGVASCQAGLVCLPGSSTAASFTVTGSAGSTVSVQYPASVTLTGPGAAMAATLDATSTLTLVAGATPFQFGGKLTVGANQIEGSYTTPDFNVDVNYN